MIARGKDLRAVLVLAGFFLIKSSSTAWSSKTLIISIVLSSADLEYSVPSGFLKVLMWLSISIGRILPIDLSAIGYGATLLFQVSSRLRLEDSLWLAL